MKDGKPNWKRAGLFALLAVAIVVVGVLAVRNARADIGGGTDSEEAVSTEQDAESVQQETETTEEDIQIELPADFAVLTEEQLSTLPDADGLSSVVNNALDNIGVQEIIGYAFGNYRSTGTVLIELETYIVTDLRNLVVYNQNLSGKWSVVYINDADSGKVYYPVTAKDAYDYLTGECINPASETSEETTTAEPAKSREISEMKLYGESVIESTEKEMADGYDYISEVSIEVDEPDSIQIVVVVASSTDTDTAKMAGEDVARYLASQASWANSYFKSPGSNDFGSLYDKYDLIVYVKDSSGSISLTGAKARNSSSFVWK